MCTHVHVSICARRACVCVCTCRVICTMTFYTGFCSSVYACVCEYARMCIRPLICPRVQKFSFFGESLHTCACNSLWCIYRSWIMYILYVCMYVYKANLCCQCQTYVSDP